MSRDSDGKFLKNAKSRHSGETSRPCDLIALSVIARAVKKFLSSRLKMNNRRLWNSH